MKRGNKIKPRKEHIPNEDQGVRIRDKRKHARVHSISQLSDDVSSKPTYFRGWVRLAEAYFQKKEFNMACDCYDTALMLKNGDNLFDRAKMNDVVSKGNLKEISGMLKQVNDYCWQDLRGHTNPENRSKEK